MADPASFYPIHFPRSTVEKRWHPLSRRNCDITAAMNIAGGALVRNAGDEGVSIVYIEGWDVAKRWAVTISDPVFDEEIGRARPGSVNVCIEYSLVKMRAFDRDMQLVSTNPVLKRPEFNWFNADAEMPKPTPHQVQAVALHTAAPNEVESLRAELDEANARAEAANRLVEDLTGDEGWANYGQRMRTAAERALAALRSRSDRDLRDAEIMLSDALSGEGPF